MRQNERMLLADLVAAGETVSGTRSRSAKIEALAAVLRALAPDEIEAATGFLAGEPRQGKIGIGWATLANVPATAATRPGLSIADADRFLDEIRRTTGPGSAAARARILAAFFERATREEADFMRRLLVGELRQGALEGIAAEAIARASGVPASSVRRALMLSGDLRTAAVVALRDGEAGVKAVGLELLRPVKPMLASTAAGVTEALASTGPASVEYKLDGVRIQVHRRDDDVRVYTRNLNDVTGRVPEIVTVVQSLPVRRAVLDGEAIAMGPSERPHVFQEIMSRFGRRSGEQELPMVPYFFDLLHAEGTDYIDRPLSERVSALGKIAAAWRIPSIVTADAGDAEAFLNDALSAGHEGVMVKATGSLYQAGRRGQAWRKVKPVRTFDLVVLGAEWGHGRRRGLLSNLHLGARDPEGGFVMVGKTFKGLTDELLRWQTETFARMESSRSGITVFIRPELVVEIAIDGVQASPRYPGGVALRFARVLRYRPDKSAAETDTIDDLRSLLTSSSAS
jgi:DNA ligase-1